MESVDKLRDWARHVKDNPHLGTLTDLGVLGLDAIAHGIEREIAERFVELPVDADGVPWHIGDVVEGHGKVQSLDLNRHGWSFFGVENAIDPAIHRHAKPRTLEDVLADFAAEIAQGRNGLEATRRYADEIRELLEVE